MTIWNIFSWKVCSIMAYTPLRWVLQLRRMICSDANPPLFGEFANFVPKKVLFVNRLDPLRKSGGHGQWWATLPVPHCAPKLRFRTAYRNCGSALRTGIAVPHRAPGKNRFIINFQENFASFLCTNSFKPKGLDFIYKNQ